jgi:hypothetical protein
MKTLALAAAVSDLAALLDYAGRRREAESLRCHLTALPSLRRGFDRHVRGGIFALRQAVPEEAREAAGEVVTRIRRVMN